MEQVTAPKLNNDNKSTPYNIDFKDYYHSKADALAEACYVFQQGCDLTFRWKNKQIFTIAEAGFGTGLNFLATWRTWANTPERCEQLHYISIEKHPLSIPLLNKLLASWPEMQSYAAELLRYYPSTLTGMHRLNLAGGKIKLTLCFMDIESALEELSITADCWFLDGFAPAKNPAMWSQEVMVKLAQLSRPGTRLATYTAASQVRRHLQSAGWQVEKRPGFGKKREMLTASLPEASQQSTRYSPWYTPPEAGTNLIHSNRHVATTPRKHESRCANFHSKNRSVTIIGGGIAGCQLAYALAQRNWQVHLIERHPELAQEASGNPAGIISPKMTAQPSWGERFYRQAFLYTLQQLKQLTAAGQHIEWDDCGSLQLNHSIREQDRWQALQQRGLPSDFIQFPDKKQASALAGIELNNGGSFFPQAGWVNPQSFCAALTQRPNIHVILETAALSLSQQDQSYLITTDTGKPLSAAQTLIIANGRDVKTLLPHSYLPLNAVKGQTSTVQASDSSSQLRITLGHEGYLTPAINGQHVFGATFERNADTPDSSQAANQVNQQQLQQYLPDFSASLNEVHSGHAAIRMATPDRYPYCGPLPDEAFYRECYADLHHGKKHKAYPPACYQPGLFIATGFGSRGLTTSALSAELLASLINGEPLPLEKSLYYQLHPARFLVKQLKTSADQTL